LLWRGLLAVAIGVVSVAWPNVTVGAFVILFAVYAFIAAAMDAVLAFSNSRAGPVAGHLLLAVLSAAAGILALAWPNITALILVISIAAWAAVTGVIEVAMAFRGHETASERAMWAITGLVSVALGAVLFIRPDIGAVSLASVFGLFSIFYGVSALILSFQARQGVATEHRLVDSPA
jgi:uncharacterized membrane protein HdeD (DUF308 family)